MANEAVLVLDDDHDFLSTLGELLEVEGFRTQLFCSAQDALAELEGGPPVLVLTDAPLPGTQSAALLRSVRDDHGWRDLPVIVFTGWSAVSIPALDGVRVVHKPDIASLMEALRSAVAGLASGLPKTWDPFHSIAACRPSAGPSVDGRT